MSELKNPFGVYHDKLITINDVPEENKGKLCDCTCPSCGGHFIAKLKDDHRRKHFAHDGDACDDVKAYLMGLYRLLCEYLNEKNVISLPALYLFFSMKENYNVDDDKVAVKFNSREPYYNPLFKSLRISPKREICCEKAEIRYDANGLPEAIVASIKNKEFALVIRPPDTVCKIAANVGQYKNLTTLQVNFSNEELFADHNRNEIFDIWRSNAPLLTWQYVHENVWQRYIPLIKEWCEVHRAEKIVEEERKQFEREQSGLHQKEQMIENEKKELEFEKQYVKRGQESLLQERRKLTNERIAFSEEKKSIENEKRHIEEEWQKIKEKQEDLKRQEQIFQKEKEEFEQEKKYIRKSQESLRQAGTTISSERTAFSQEKRVVEHEQQPTTEKENDHNENVDSSPKTTQKHNQDIIDKILSTKKPYITDGYKNIPTIWRVCKNCESAITQYNTTDRLVDPNAPYFCVCNKCASQVKE